VPNLPSDLSKRSQTPVQDPILSLWQSAAKAVGLDVFPSATGLDASAGFADLMSPVLFVSELVSSATGAGAEILAAPIPQWMDNCARVAAHFLWAELRGDHAAARRLSDELKKSECDPRWSECLRKYLEYKATAAPFLYRDKQNSVFEISETTTIAVIGDWGTGDAIALHLLKSLLPFQPDLLQHLGDIYYSGTCEEAQRNFFDPARQLFRDKFPFYSLCGNHDMYSGGRGYYELVDAIGQRSSYFVLENRYWQLLAMDTGHNDSNPLTVATNMTSVNADETAWHMGRILNPQGRRTILLSHHPLFSAFGAVGRMDGVHYAYNPKLCSAFGSVFGRVEWWFWGHEHTLAVYEPYMGLQRGRCVGASAVPVFKDQQPYETNWSLKTLKSGDFPAWKKEAELTAFGEDYGHVFALLRLAEQMATADYYQVAPEGEAWLLWSESHDFGKDPPVV
jgi:hypothetical protein